MAEPKRYRLLERAEMNGALRDPGYIFTLSVDKDGIEIPGPHRTVVASNHGAQITDHIGGEQNLTDVPLYEEVKDDPATPHDESKGDLSREELEAELEQARGRVTSLEAEVADKDKQIGEAHARLANVERALTGPLETADEAAVG
jgi:hypothetical protein